MLVTEAVNFLLGESKHILLCMKLCVNGGDNINESNITIMKVIITSMAEKITII